MTERMRWPDNAEEVRTTSLTHIRSIRETIRYAVKISKEIEVVRQLIDALEYTHMIENDLKSVGPKAEKEQRAEREQRSVML